MRSEDAEILLSASSVNVPATYMGVSSIRTPSSPLLSVGTVRTWDYMGAPSGNNPCVIKYINPTTAGVYDWTTFDLLLTSNPTQDVIVTLGQPADWMITRAALGGAVYGGKANMCPTGATELGNYLPCITAMVERAKNTHGRTGLKWELWNEIEGPGMLANAELSALGPYARQVYQAIKAVDPTAVVMSPSARDHDTAFLIGDFLNRSDGIGGFARSWVDAIAWHFYGLDEPWTYAHTVETYRNELVRGGLSASVPIYVTESGTLTGAPEFGVKLQRRAIVYAALGMKCFLAYAYDYATEPISSEATYWNDVASWLPGSTITSCIKLSDGRVRVIANGVTRTY